MGYQATGWSRERRVVLVIQEKPDEFLLHDFWLLTSWTEEEKDAVTLLEPIANGVRPRVTSASS
jgi:hypothetical protein